MTRVLDSLHYTPGTRIGLLQDGKWISCTIASTCDCIFSRLESHSLIESMLVKIFFTKTFRVCTLPMIAVFDDAVSKSDIYAPKVKKPKYGIHRSVSQQRNFSEIFIEWLRILVSKLFREIHSRNRNLRGVNHGIAFNEVMLQGSFVYTAFWRKIQRFFEWRNIDVT